MSSINPLQLRLWLETLESGFVSLAPLHVWAKQQLLSPEAQPRWVVQLYDANSYDQALAALGEALNFTLEQSPSEAENIPDPAALHLGFLYLRFERGDLSLRDLLLAAGRETDAGGGPATPPCEAFYRLASEMDADGPTDPSPAPLAHRAAALFAPFALLARRHLHHLP